MILFGLGLLNVVAFTAVLRRFASDWLWAGLALVAIPLLPIRSDAIRSASEEQRRGA